MNPRQKQTKYVWIGASAQNDSLSTATFWQKIVIFYHKFHDISIQKKTIDEEHFRTLPIGVHEKNKLQCFS